MNKTNRILLAAIIMSCLVLGFTAFINKPTKDTKQRIVCFKFKSSASENNRQQHIEDFAKLGKDIPEVHNYKAGSTIQGDFNAAPEYDIMHYMTFKDEAAINKYFNDPRHQEFIKRNKDSWEKVLVINSNTDK